VAYGLGGTEPTVTDADLMLGVMRDGAQLGGAVTLSAELAAQALQRLGERAGLTAEQAALGVVRVADAEMVRALRAISVERGIDPRDYALVAFGGAGGMHACALADELGMRTVLVPRAGGVLSALGLAISDIRRDYVAPLLDTMAALDPAQLGQAWEALCEQARADLAEFTAGPRLEDDTVQIVNVRVVATVPTERPDLVEPDPPDAEPRIDRRAVLVEGEWAHVDVLDRGRMGRGSTVTGPVVIEDSESTCLVRPGWTGVVDRVGTLVLTRGEDTR
jgi:N-methylhydantoinase A